MSTLELKRLSKKEKEFLESQSKKALILLIPDKLEDYQETRLLMFIQTSFRKLHCCTLYSLNKDFTKLLSKLGLNPNILGKKEAIILSNMSLMYTEDYTLYPE